MSGNISQSDAVKLGEIIAKAWQDESFRKDLIANPKKILTTAGIKLPEGANIHVVRDTFLERNAVLSNKPLPKEQELDELPVPANLYQVYAHIYTRCQKDPDFCKKFKTDPVAVVESLGITVPKGLKINVLEANEKDKYFVIPLSPATRISDELSVEELEMVAGGKSKTNVNVNSSVNVQSALNVSSGVNVAEAVNAGVATQVGAAAAAAVVVAVAVII
ncbi:MAG: NHLP leader peptide family RiPP precursor [Verrucomicrobiae bacterium]|nr:NHLP leader peptide family RiPP precursor [Verrucomicrobiae bacterium]